MHGFAVVVRIPGSWVVCLCTLGVYLVVLIVITVNPQPSRKGTWHPPDYNKAILRPCAQPPLRTTLMRPRFNVLLIPPPFRRISYRLGLAVTRGAPHRRFLSDWNTKVDELRATWKTKVDELAEKLAVARRNRNRRWGGGAEGIRGGGGGGGGWVGDGEGAPLLLLARMFAQEQAAIEELGDMWVRDPKWTGFFLPQVICLFYCCC